MKTILSVLVFGILMSALSYADDRVNPTGLRCYGAARAAAAKSLGLKTDKVDESVRLHVAKRFLKSNIIREAYQFQYDESVIVSVVMEPVRVGKLALDGESAQGESEWRCRVTSIE
jgi:hypothetical protein